MLFLGGLVAVVMLVGLAMVAGIAIVTWLIVKWLFIILLVIFGLIGGAVGEAYFHDPLGFQGGALTGIVLCFGILILWMSVISNREEAARRARELAQRLEREAGSQRQQQAAAQSEREAEKRRLDQAARLNNNAAVRHVKKWLG